MVPTPDAKIKGCHSTAIVDSSKLSWATIWWRKPTSGEPSGNQTWQWKIDYISVIFRVKPPFPGHFPVSCLITRGETKRAACSKIWEKMSPKLPVSARIQSVLGGTSDARGILVPAAVLRHCPAKLGSEAQRLCSLVFILVGGWATPLKIWKSVGMIIPNISGKIKVMFQSPPTSYAKLPESNPKFGQLARTSNRALSSSGKADF